MPGPVLGVLNPMAAGGRSRHRWDHLLPVLRDRFPGLEVRLTEGPGHAETLGREWVARHPEGDVIVGGGDGTVHEAVNGLLTPGWGGALGVVATGTGNDFATNTSAGEPPPADRRRVDVGRMQWSGADGTSRTRLFLNAVSVGVSPFANRMAGAVKGWLPGRFSYAVAGVAALIRRRPQHFRVIGEGCVILDGNALNVTLANGPTFGGGMRISPRSRHDDGHLDQVTIEDIGPFRALAALSRLYAGTHVLMRGVSTTPAPGSTCISSPGGPMLAEADGHDWVIEGELRVDLLPAALPLLRLPSP